MRIYYHPARYRPPPCWFSHAVGRGSFAQTPRSVGGCGLAPSLSSRCRPVARGARARRHVENKPTVRRVLFTARCVLGAVVCLRGQLATRSTTRRWPRLLCADTTLGRRLRLRTVGAVSFSSRGARRVRVLSRGEPADRPQSTFHCALRAWRGCLSARPTRDALHHTPLAEAPLRRHHARSAASASNCRSRLVLVPWRAARARFVTGRTS